MGTWLSTLCEYKNEDQGEIKEVKLYSYKALSDNFLLSAEEKYILLKKVPFTTFAKLLIKFDIRKAAPSEDENPNKPLEIYPQSEDYLKVIPEAIFQNFIENKIYQLDCLYKYVGENENVAVISKTLLMQLYIWLKKTMIKYAKREREGQYDTNFLKVYHILAIGFLYCGGSNLDKIKFLFSTFKQPYTTKIRRTDELQVFLNTLCWIPTATLVMGVKYLSENYDDIPKIEKRYLLGMGDAFEGTDRERLVTKFLSELFSFDREYELADFVDQFRKREFGFILSPRGIRLFLEENNDNTGNDLKKIFDSENVATRLRRSLSTKVFGE